MNILFIYPNTQGYPRVPHGQNIIMVMLEHAGHNIELFDTTFLFTDRNMVDDEKELVGIVKPGSVSFTQKYFKKHSPEEIDDLLREKISKFDPDLIAFGILEDNYEYSDRLMGVIKAMGNIPILAGGTTPTVAPRVLAENPNIDWVMQGEAESPMLDFITRMDAKRSVNDCPGLVYEKDGEIITNPMGGFTDLDDIPYQEFHHWGDGHLVKGYDGKVMRAGYIEMSRGCMLKCSFCVNVTYQELMEDSGYFYRKKSIDNVINEAKAQIASNDVEMFFFCDDNFLSVSSARLKEFSKRWAKEIDKPFWINTTVESLHAEEKVKTLRSSGCHGIGIGLETGSEIMRSVCLHKFTKNDKIRSIFNALKRNNFRTTANIILGFPGETFEDVYHSVRFVREIEADTWNAKFLSPYYATPIYYIARNLGYIDVYEDRPGFNGLAKRIGFGRSAGPPIRTWEETRFPVMTKEEMIDTYMNFSNYVLGKLPFPSKGVPNGKKSESYESLGPAKTLVIKEYHKENLLPRKLINKYASELGVTASVDNLSRSEKKRSEGYKKSQPQLSSVSA